MGSSVAALYLLIAVGYICERAKIISRRGAKQMTNLLLLIVTPVLIVYSFQMEFTGQYASGLLFSAAAAVVLQLVGIAAANIFIRRRPAKQLNIMRFAVTYSNCGFMAIPLTFALVGPQGVFYGSAFVAVFNIFIWTHGLYRITGDKKAISFKKAFLNPGVIGVAIALPLFLLSVRIKGAPYEAIRHISALNTPLAMIITGVTLSRVKLKTVFADIRAYIVSLLRLIVVPSVIFALLYLLCHDRTVFIACLVPSCAPVAVNAVLFASKYDGDVELASKILAATTLFSVLTIPLFIVLADMLFL